MTLHSIVIQKLLSTNAHIGRRVATHHFKQFTYGYRNRMAIIDSDRTLICLRNAAHFIAAMAHGNARFMFVNTNSLWDEIIEQMTKKIGCYSPSLTTLWRTGGFLTNAHSPKKFRSRRKKIVFGPTQPPDCLVVFDSERKSSVILEAHRLQIPIVSLVGSDTPIEDFNKITYPIPCNNTSEKFVYLFCNLITKTFLLEQKKMNKHSAAEIEASEKVGAIEEANAAKKDELLVVPVEFLNISTDVEKMEEMMDKLVVVKLNGASGTSMGFSGPRSTMETLNGLTSLDLIVNQIQSLNSKYHCSVPLVLVNTDSTHEDTLKVLEKYSSSGINFESIKQTHPQLKSQGGPSGEDELSPSGHGAVLLSLLKNRTLDVLLSKGKEYVLLVDSDNVAAKIDPKILNHLVENKIDYCMEITPTSSYDLDLIGSRSQLFELAEIAQTSVRDSIERFKLVDTGSLWVNVKALKRLLDTDEIKIEDISVSKETESDQVLLQESAVGSPIRFLKNALGVKVPNSQFLSMNKTSDLLLLKSNLYMYDDEGGIVRNIARTNPANPLIELGPEFDKVSDLLSRFKSMPDIIDLDSLKVTGDVWFGAGITLKGRVTIHAKPGMKLEIPDEVVIENEVIEDGSDF